MKVILTEEQFNRVILKEQTTNAEGQIEYGGNKYVLQADTIIPFYNPVIEVTGFDTLSQGEIKISYKNPRTHEDEFATLNDKDIIQDLKDKIKKGIQKIIIRGGINNPKVRELILNKV